MAKVIIDNKDVIIVGAGIFGLCSAYFSVLRGLSVAVLDAGLIGGRASSGPVGAMTPHTPDNWNAKKQFQFEALQEAESFWAEIDLQSNHCSGYGRIGRIFPITNERLLRLAVNRIEAAKINWQGNYTWNKLDNHPLIASEFSPFGVVQDSFSARISPQNACYSLKITLIKLGVEFYENKIVTEFKDHKVFGTWGEACGENIILATGAEGFQLLNNHLNLKMGSGVKGQAALLSANMKGLPQISAEGLYIVPHDNGTVGIGSTSEKDWDQAYTTDEKLDEIIAIAKRICPILKNSPVIERWAALRPKARKRTPMLGKLPEVNGIYVAMGGFKIGFGIAHKIGSIMTDIIQNIPTNIPDNFTLEHHSKL